MAFVEVEDSDGVIGIISAFDVGEGVFEPPGGPFKPVASPSPSLEGGSSASTYAGLYGR